jgi:hypothetical protein
MKRLLLTLAAALYLFSNAGFAQEYEDLLNMYIDEDYEKLASKAYAYTQNDKHKKNPLPYIYCAMGYYEMSKQMEYMEDYPRAQSDAMKYVVKFRKKDKDLQYWNDHQDFISELRATVIEDAENMLDVEKTIKKSFKIYKSLTAIDPNDGTAWLMRGYCELKIRMVTEAVKSHNIAMPLINAIASIQDIAEEQADLLKFGLMSYSQYLLDEGRTDSAKVTIDCGYKYFEEDKEYKMVFDKVKSN